MWMATLALLIKIYLLIFLSLGGEEGRGASRNWDPGGASVVWPQVGPLRIWAEIATPLSPHSLSPFLCKLPGPGLGH